MLQDCSIIASCCIVLTLHSCSSFAFHKCLILFPCCTMCFMIVLSLRPSAPALFHQYIYVFSCCQVHPCTSFLLHLGYHVHHHGRIIASTCFTSVRCLRSWAYYSFITASMYSSIVRSLHPRVSLLFFYCILVLHHRFISASMSFIDVPILQSCAPSLFHHCVNVLHHCFIIAVMCFTIVLSLCFTSFR